jgi:hypothetical protein
VIVVLGALGAAALLTPAPALAHGITGKLDLPIPKWLFAWAAAIVLIVSFVGLATLWPTPRLERKPRTRVLLRFHRVWEPICGAIGVALFAIVVYAGIAGEQYDLTANLAPTFIFVLFWVGVPFVSAVLGDVFRAFNPWRATARAVAWTGCRRRWPTPAGSVAGRPQRASWASRGWSSSMSIATIRARSPTCHSVTRPCNSSA